MRPAGGPLPSDSVLDEAIRSVAGPMTATLHRLRPPLWPTLLLGAGVVLASALFAVSQGAVAIPPATVTRIVLTRLPGVELAHTWPESWDVIIWQIRLPRVVMAGLVGATLAYAGATYQGIFRNPLADPYLIGVAAGAALGATIAIVSPFSLSFYHFSLLTLFAFGGALIAAGAAYLLARVGRTVPTTTLVLAGVAISSLASAATSFLMMNSGERIQVIFAWLFGSFTAVTWEKLWLLLPYTAPAALVILVHGRILNVLQLEEEQAQQLGIDVERTKLLLLGAASLATAAAISVTGIIGFVGLIVPHTTRLLWGPDYCRLLPLSMVLGASFLILADLAARSLFAPVEMPVGIVTAFCGGPFFLWLLRQRKRMVF